ncbi:MAG: putative D,D-dipeptide transport system permease protein DdpC [Firmicutes bacterium ADurb.BinA052]|nr:MAG: putative D,D-dipeptide transport system permease protein DdpC [Firmicutes bacterium ADurb.BinA052]
MASWIRALVSRTPQSADAEGGPQRRDLSGAVGVAIVLIVALLAAFAPLVAPHDPNAQDLLGRLKPPGWRSPYTGAWFLLGTDHLGRDVLSRIIYGSRVSLFVGIVSVAITAALGTLLGLAAGYYRGFTETIIMRCVDLVMSLPFMLLALAVIGITGPGLQNLILVVALTRWARYTRVIYGQTLSYAQKEFVEAAQALGSSNSRILFHHMLPNLLPSTIVLATLDLGFVIILESGLSFLGLGVPPTISTWGTMLADGRAYLNNAWWMGTFPGLAIMVTVLGFNLLGDWTRDLMDPTLRV